MAVVLFRNPKTGGTSVGSALQLALRKDDRVHVMDVNDHDTFLSRFEDALAKYDFVQTWGAWFHNSMKFYGEELMTKHHVVTLMRNPYDRYISSWAYAKQKGWIPEDTSPFDLSWMTTQNMSRLAWHHTFRPQINNLYYYGELHVHQVLRFEHLEEDFRDLATRLDVPDAKLHQLNPSEHRPWREYYEEDPTLRSRVEAAIPEDFAALPYTFEQDAPSGPVPRRLNGE